MDKRNIVFVTLAIALDMEGYPIIEQNIKATAEAISEHITDEMVDAISDMTGWCVQSVSVYDAKAAD